jgi:3-hydroxyacyl-[acyl-carrier-protein] dehydratase
MINQINKAIVQATDVTKYIPHRAPLVMVDALYMCSEKVGMAGLTIKYNNVFVEQDELQEPGLIEHMAQTMALKMAYEQSLRSDKKFMGFLVVVRDLKIRHLPKVGQEVVTRAEAVSDHGGLSVARFKAHINGKQIATCEMRLLMV